MVRLQGIFQCDKWYTWCQFQDRFIHLLFKLVLAVISLWGPGLKYSSTIHALVDMLHHWHLHADWMKISRVLLLDYSKAFDLVYHNILVKTVVQLWCFWYSSASDWLFSVWQKAACVNWTRNIWLASRECVCSTGPLAGTTTFCHYD